MILRHYYFIILILLANLKFISTSKKRRHIDHPSDDAAHVVPHHSEGRHRRIRSKLRTEDPGTVSSEASDAELPIRQGRLRFRSDNSEQSQTVEISNNEEKKESGSEDQPEVVSVKDVFNQQEETSTPPQVDPNNVISVALQNKINQDTSTATPADIPSTSSNPPPPPPLPLPLPLPPSLSSTNIQSSATAPTKSFLEGLRQAQAAQAATIAIKPEVSPPPPASTSASLSHTSYASDEHLPDAKPETPTEEPDPFAEFNTETTTAPSTVNSASTSTTLVSSQKTEEESVKIIGKGSGGLPAHLTGFNDQSSTDGSSSSSSSSSSINTVTEKVSQFPTEKQNNPFSFLAASDPAVKETTENTNDSPKQPSPDNSVENAIQKALNNQLVLPPVPPSQLVLPPVPPSSNLTNEVFKSFPALPGQNPNERSIDASITPTEHSYHRFLDKKIREALVKNNGVIEVVLLGDSILSHIQRDGNNWIPFSRRYKAMNLGSPGDRTEHVLHRLSIEDMTKPISNARNVVIMIGTNNVGVGDSVDAVFNGVVAVVTKVREKFNSKVHVILLSILPRASVGLTTTIEAVNKKLENKYEGHEKVHYLNIFDKFVDSSKKANHKMFMPDHVHPSANAYEYIISAIKPLLDGKYPR